MNGVEMELTLDELRSQFLVHTRQAYGLLPYVARPRILDIGCGRGLQTLAIAQLSDGEIVAIDTDARALASLQSCVEKAGLTRRIKVVNVSLYETGFPDAGFDILWEEGVMHLLDSTRSLPACRRLLKSGGFLVMHEDVTWFGSLRGSLQTHGFQSVAHHPLPRHFWWTDYYKPLEVAIRNYRERHGDEPESPELAQLDREIGMVKADPGRFDCAFFVLQKAVSRSAETNNAEPSAQD
ncbi:class I SAM-dependent methyltransferase [Myxococcota bacterium]